MFWFIGGVVFGAIVAAFLIVALLISGDEDYLE